MGYYLVCQEQGQNATYHMAERKYNVMSVKVLKLIIVTDEDTNGIIMDYDAIPIRERDRTESSVQFTFTDRHGVSHLLHFVHAEEVLCHDT